MKFCFVILHYKTEQDTKDCIESIERITVDASDELSIVVVDNASNNGSVEALEGKYDKTPYITFIKNDENLGFARGNNIGYDYAKNVLNADFIIILNNDIIVSSEDIFDKIKQAYKEHKFHLLGPDIISLVDNMHQNPSHRTSTDVKYMKKEISRYKRLLMLSKLGLYDMLKSAKKKVSGDSNKKVEDVKVEMQENCQLHGSCLIYSPLYIKNEIYAFYPGTFLYCEEPILYQHCVKKKYKTLLYPDIKIFHKEDSSTSFTTNTTKGKREFVFKHLIKSRKEYVKYLEDDSLWK